VSGTRDVAGRRYASAILEIARDSNTLDSWSEAVEGLGALTAQPGYSEALQGDGMTDEAFQSIVKRVIPDISTEQMNLFRLLRRKNRLILGPSIQSFFQELVDEERNIARAMVTSAVELDGSQADDIAGKLSDALGKNIIIETRVDESIIGGLVIRVGDQLIDASTRGQLSALKSHIART